MGIKSDIEIAQEADMRVINEVAGSIGIPDKYVENYGKYKAKIDYRFYNDELRDRPDAKVVLVTAINPTPAGEGKTTTTIGATHRSCRWRISTFILRGTYMPSERRTI